MILQGQVAIVTGAGRGIGRVTALMLADEGAQVVLLSRTIEQTNAVAAEITGKYPGLGALPIECDVSDEEQVATMAARTMERFGRIDILVNNAGYSKPALVHEMTLADWQMQFAINTTGTFLCTRAVLPAMLAQKQGRIINVLSGAGKRGYARLSGYAAAKFGIVGFAQSLQMEVREEGIAVTCVFPGPTLTRMGSDASSAYKSEDMLKPVDVATAIVYAATQPAHVIVPELIVRPRAYLY